MNDAETRSWFGRRRLWTAVLVVLGLLLAILSPMHFLPVTVDDTSVSNPAANFEEARARVQAIQAEERAGGLINPVCESLLMTHEEKTDNVIVFMHGFTSCPEQFRELGEQFLELGYNVYIPRLPYHGNADRDGRALLQTTAEELAAFTRESTDIAQGLGERVVVGGLSGGGTLTAWIAQEHADVDRAVAVAPFLGIGFIPTALNRMVARVVDDIPNIEMWWDPRSKAENPNTAAYAYPSYPLHGLAEYLRLGFAAQDKARQVKPAVPSIMVITNAHDDSVSNGVTARLLAAWRGHGEEYLEIYEFADKLGLPHDLISPTHDNGDPALVYPVIVDSVTGSDE